MSDRRDAGVTDRGRGADPRHMADNMELSPDAATVLGLAGTALAFTNSTGEQVERWIRTLRLYGEAGVTLQSLGVGEAPPLPDEAGDPPAHEPRAIMAAVLGCAEEFAQRRGTPCVGTVELLLSVMRVYGQAFDCALERQGTDRAEVVERLEAGVPAAAE